MEIVVCLKKYFIYEPLNLSLLLGGGLFVKKTNIWYLLGIVSFSALRDYGKPYCSTNDYGVFVSVHKFAGWLDQYLLTSANRYDVNNNQETDEIDSKKSLESNELNNLKHEF